jgi:HSP20 family protein
MNANNRWDPAREFVSLREAMNRLFEDSVISQGQGQGQRDGQAAELRLPVDAYATEHEIVLRAAVPGLTPEAVEITLEGDTLTIRGELPRPIDNVGYIFQERPWGRFSRSLQLNVPVEANRVEAVFENGMLTLTLPKAEAVRPKLIPIKTRK